MRESLNSTIFDFQLNLQGLYCEGKLDVLSLVQYSTLALTSLLDTSCNTHNDAHTGRVCTFKRENEEPLLTKRLETFYIVMCITDIKGKTKEEQTAVDLLAL